MDIFQTRTSFLRNSRCSDAGKFKCNDEEQSFVCLTETGDALQTGHTITLDIPSLMAIGGSEMLSADDSSPVILLSYKGTYMYLTQTAQFFFVSNVEESLSGLS